MGVYGSTPELRALAQDPAANFTATVNGAPLAVQDGSFVLPCPAKESTVRLALKSDASVWDEITVKPYSKARQAFLPTLQKLDTLYCSFSCWTRYHWAFGEHSVLKALGRL